MNTANQDTRNHVEIYTDGACIGNPGPGGWAAIIRAMAGQTEINRHDCIGSRADTTNNRMELRAVIDGLETLEPIWPVTVYTDSQYVSKGITEWLPKWKAKGWKTSNHKPVANQDLWMRLDEIVSQHSVKFVWVRGHAGNELNEQADDLANIAAMGAAYQAGRE